jgi:hypothetical protein
VVVLGVLGNEGKDVRDADSLKNLARTEVAFATVGLVLASGAFVVHRDSRSLVGYTLAGAFLAFLLYAGRELQRGTRKGIVLSLVAQLLQVVHLNTDALVLFFLGGPWLEIGASKALVQVTVGVSVFPPRLGVDTLAGSVLDVHFGLLLDPSAPHSVVRVGANLIALTFALRLWRALAPESEFGTSR